ncbi:MFS transporter [Rhodopseudomonas boonkerdii]|uniref:MFS transporter n=1 Tax=Rhodopseudomonas boonkerdii TaxID=475937 RepID=UPI001E3C205A|nr:MFS transporter [Rhodopseudomonas boonkerdii]UGV26194.1 MFS transporter [Rhodopseudomonas boonkerdii]
MSRFSSRLLFPAAVIIVGINLRPALAAVGPLLDAIQRDTGLGDTGASLLTTLPVVLMGVCLFGAAWLRRLFGERGGIALGAVLIVLACAMRWWFPDLSTLLLTAVLGGIGIAIVQALMPSVIRAQAGGSAARLMGLYSTAIMGGALIASTLSPWIARSVSWPAALGIWAVPALVGLAAWWKVMDRPDTATSGSAHRAIYRFPRAWVLLAFFGLGTGAYTLVLAWLPPFYTRFGWTAEAAGALLGLVTLAEVVSGIAVSLWINRLPDRRPALLVAIGALLVGLLCLCLAPLSLAWPAALFAGLGIGALFPLSLIVSMDHAGDAGEAGAIVGFVQGGGYVLAALLPFIAGLLRQHLSDLTPAWWLMALLCVVMAGIAVRLRPECRLLCDV